MDKDMLEDIFERQKFLQTSKFVKDMIFENDVDRQYYINMQILALYNELAELQNETEWKKNSIKYGWKRNIKFNKENYLKEAADILHFFVNLLLAVDIDAKALHKEYCKKVEENYQRQNDGY